jgi:hypothetical protein
VLVSTVTSFGPLGTLRPRGSGRRRLEHDLRRLEKRDRHGG